MLHSSKKHSGVQFIVRGILLAAVITMVGCMLLAKLVDSEMMQMEGLGYGAMLVLALSSWAAAMIAKGAVQDNRVAGAALGSGGYFLLLLIVNWLFLGGRCPGFWSALLVVGSGALAAILMTGQGRGRAPRKRYKIPKT